MPRILGVLAVALTVVATVFVLTGDTMAGQFKRIRGIPNGGEIQAHASPKNFGQAMEMDVYEFESTTVVDSFRCRIVSNTTGRSLNLRLIGVNGTIIGSCATPVNGTCFTPTFSLVPNLLFQCTVSTANGQPVSGSAHYIVAVGRP